MAIPMAGAPPAGAAFFSPATFTFILRPSTCAPFIDATARCAASRSANLTNPNPRAEPSGLRTTRALSISPLLSNSARSRPSSMCSASEPTYTFDGSNGRSPRAAPNPAPIPPAPPTAPAIPGTLSTPSSERKLWYSLDISACAPAAAAALFRMGQSRVGCPPSPQMAHVTSATSALYDATSFSGQFSCVCPGLPQAWQSMPSMSRSVPLMSASSRSCARLCSLKVSSTGLSSCRTIAAARSTSSSVSPVMVTCKSSSSA